MRGLSKLLRLAELRRTMAERRLAARYAGLQAAEEKVSAAKEHKNAVARDVASKQDALREAFMGSVHARRAVEDMVMDMTGLEALTEKAEQEVRDAQSERDDAISLYKEAQKQLVAAHATVTKRKELVDRQRRVARIAHENALDAEVEEQWVGQNFYARVPMR